MPQAILIADNDPNSLVSLEYLLLREGYTVHLAHDGDETLAVLRREQPHLLLLDVMMPGKSGLEVCQAVRHDDALKDTRILILSAKASPTDIVKGLALGADAYMTKPFSTRELLDKVRELLAPAAA